MPNLDETKPAVNHDLLTMLRDAYFEGFGDRSVRNPNWLLDVAERQRCWLSSDTYKNVGELAAKIIRDKCCDPPHHRLDPGYGAEPATSLIPPQLEHVKRASDSDAARFNAGHKTQDD